MARVLDVKVAPSQKAPGLASWRPVRAGDRIEVVGVDGVPRKRGRPLARSATKTRSPINGRSHPIEYERRENDQDTLQHSDK